MPSYRFVSRLALVATAVLPAVFVAAAASAQQAAMKVGVVDIARALETTEDGMRAQAMLKKLFDSKQQEFARKQQELMKQRDELEKKRSVVSQQVLDKEKQAWEREYMQLETLGVEYQKEMQKKRLELLYPVQEKILKAIQRLANGTEGQTFDLIIDRATVAYVRSDLDLTDRVIQLTNSGAGGNAAPRPSGSGAPVAPTLAPTGLPLGTGTGLPRQP